MHTLEKVNSLNLSEIETLVFAGGGNRCWWQAGVLSQLLAKEFNLPKQLVGTSAGAAIALSCLTDGPFAAMESLVSLLANISNNIDRTQLARFKLCFAHEELYPKLISSILHDAHFNTLNQAHSKLSVAITRPVKMFGVLGSALVGTLAYIVDKHLWHTIHPKLPRYLGLRQEFLDLHQCKSVDDARLLVVASAAAPPVMPSRRIQGALAMDGGYVDSAAIPEQMEEEQSKTLVLLTRHYEKLPPLFRLNGRLYWQPSQKVPVSTWECTFRTAVRDAFAHGEQDAQQMIRSGDIVPC